MTSVDHDNDVERNPRGHVRSGLEEYERSGGDRPPFVLTRTELKILGIAGVGFFLDAYDLFIINPVATMLQYRLYGGATIPAGLQGFLKAGANIGSIIGQFGFGYAADALGRKAVYGKELMLIIIATILCISTPTGTLSPTGSLLYLSFFRILLGVGVGGDYPMSASVSSDRTSIRKRGVLLAYIFANQGWGSFVGSMAVLVVLACYKGVMDGKGDTGKVDGVWRIVMGLSLIPAFATLYQRLTLPESVRFTKSQGGGQQKRGGEHDRESTASEDDEIEMEKRKMRAADAKMADNEKGAVKDADAVTVEEREAPAGGNGNNGFGGKKTAGSAEEHGAGVKEVAAKKKAHFREFAIYFSEWRHAKILLGTSLCWFFLDIAFYGINLNQNVVLQQIGFDGSEGTPWHRLFKIAIGNIIITALGFVPGYYATVLTIEYLGRKFIQIQGFLMAALFLAILAGKFHTLNTASFLVCFAFLQFFFNFGANSTTYCYPAEVFPTRFKAFAHGLSAAAGKAGAIISALAFNSLSEKVGTPKVLWIFFGCCLAGALCTLLLPEVKGRDPDVVDAEEIRAANVGRRAA